MEIASMTTLDYPDQAPVSTDDAERIATLTRKGWTVRPDPTPEEVAANIAQQKADIWEQIKAHRDHQKNAGVKVGAHWFHSDADSRIQQLGLVMMGANVPSVSWKTMSGEFVTMSQTLAGQIFQATAASDMTLFTIAEQHHAALNASADLANYNWRTGWPETFTG